MNTDDVTRIAALGRRVRESVGAAVVGMDEPLTIALAAIFAGGHVLFEDVPRARQDTRSAEPGLCAGPGLPAIAVHTRYAPRRRHRVVRLCTATGDFEFRPGPIFTGLLLADEINRTTPKTQSAMLEAMAEHQVTVEGNRFPLPQPFHVVATSNPIEYEGTYALPEAQLDRFMVRLSVGYPDVDDETRIILDRVRRQSSDVSVEPVVDGEGLLRSSERWNGSTSTRTSPATASSWSAPRVRWRTSRWVPLRAARSPWCCSDALSPR